MATIARYHVIIRDGRKVVERHQMIDYEMALYLAENLEQKYPRYSVEFKDTAPFGATRNY
jgi:hypothetical protein